MREIVLDTETTGLNPALDRVIEIGCVELVNHVPSGRTFQVYLNPDRSVDNEAELVHGITNAFLRDKPRFAEAAATFLEFVGDARLIAHNASFDLTFLNAEFNRMGRTTLAEGRMVDTVTLAKRHSPSGPASLDALCSRFGIDTSKRTLHGALLDATLLAEVYIELIGGRQISLGFGDMETSEEILVETGAPLAALPRPMPLPPRLTDAAREAHQTLVRSFGGKALWLAYQPPAEAAA
jgi:DNA polymerase-3 subunit epsilon